jgi:hypothetical protein
MKKQFITISILISLLFINHLIFAQTNEENLSKCDCTECRQFDFWIGKWKVKWNDNDGNLFEGTNTVNSILEGCVIEENFDGNPGMNFRGKSLSVYNHTHKVWQQTWVDTEGFYMLFIGGMQDSKMILSRTVETTDGPLTQRMVFYNIQKDSFDWNWESSTVDGKNWKLNWELKYTRIN